MQNHKVTLNVLQASYKFLFTRYHVSTRIIELRSTNFLAQEADISLLINDAMAASIKFSYFVYDVQMEKVSLEQRRREARHADLCCRMTWHSTQLQAA